MKASEIIKELLLAPYPDSDIESLFETVQARIRVALPAIEAAEACVEVLEKHLIKLGYPYFPVSKSQLAGALKAYKEASHAS